jgi:sulfide:quinone oxidoreductase
LEGSVFEVVIAGAGVGALESALALRELAGDRTSVTLVAPTADFVYRPMAVLEPFERRTPRRLALAEFAAEVGVSFVQDGITRVDVEQRIVYTSGGRAMSYDALVVAVGAKREATPSRATWIDFFDTDAVTAAIADTQSGSVGSIAFVALSPGWPLPVYELALLTRERQGAVEIEILTSEARPLEVFGGRVSEAVSELLHRGDIRVATHVSVDRLDEGALLAGGKELGADVVVVTPRLSGPAIPGLPADVDGFLPITKRCEVPGADCVYAVGDATDFPVKFGSIAAQHADAAAQAIAARAGAPVSPTPFDGEVHGFLLGGRKEPVLYFTARIEGGRAVESDASLTTFSHDPKIAARYLAPYLDDKWAAGLHWFADELWWADVLARIKRDNVS